MQHCSVKTRIGFREFELNADMGFFEAYQQDVGKCAMHTAMKVVEAVAKATTIGENIISYVAQEISMVEAVKFLHLATKGNISEQEIKEQVMFSGPAGRAIDNAFFEANFDEKQHAYYRELITSEILDSFYLPVYQLAQAIVNDCYVAFGDDASTTADKKKAAALDRCLKN